MSERWAKVPVAILDVEGLTLADLKVYVAMRSLCIGSTSLTRSHAEVAEVAKVSRDSARRAVQHLASSGLLEVQRTVDDRGYNSASTYVFEGGCTDAPTRTDAPRGRGTDAPRGGCTPAPGVGAPVHAQLQEGVETSVKTPAQTTAQTAAARATTPTWTTVEEATAGSVRRNQWAGRCLRCSETVGAEEGTIAKDEQGRWRPVHDGPCPGSVEYHAAAHQVERVEEPPAVVQVQQDPAQRQRITDIQERIRRRSGAA